jgi:hypothetical protein
VYYECEDCGVVEKAPGKCEFCDEALVKKTSGKDVCPHCFRKPEPCEVCVKTYYECEDCGHQAAAPGKCEDCDAPLVKKVSRAVVEYACPECGDSALKLGKCSEEGCENFGKSLVRQCSMSGEFPHVKPSR